MNNKYQSMMANNKMEKTIDSSQRMPSIPSIFPPKKTIIPRYIFQKKLGCYKISMDYLSKFINTIIESTENETPNKDFDEYVNKYTEMTVNISKLGKQLTNTILFAKMNERKETTEAGNPIQCWKDVISWFKKPTSTDEQKIYYSYDIYDVKHLTRLIMQLEHLEYCPKVTQTINNTKKRADGWIAESITKNIQAKRNTVRHYLYFIDTLQQLISLSLLYYIVDKK